MENVKGAALKKASSSGKKGAKSSFRHNHNFSIFITSKSSTLETFANPQTIFSQIASTVKGKSPYSKI